MKTKVSIFYAYKPSTLKSVEKKFGGFLIELSRQQMVKEIEEQITRALNLFDTNLKKQSAEHQIKNMSFALL